MVVFYHYTTPDSAIRIRRSGVIFKSKMQVRRGRRVDTTFGEGVYMTRVPPNTPKIQIALNNYDGRVTSPATEAMLQSIISKGKMYLQLED